MEWGSVISLLICDVLFIALKWHPVHIDFYSLKSYIKIQTHSGKQETHRRGGLSR